MLFGIAYFWKKNFFLKIDLASSSYFWTPFRFIVVLTEFGFFISLFCSSLRCSMLCWHRSNSMAIRPSGENNQRLRTENKPWSPPENTERWHHQMWYYCQKWNYFRSKRCGQCQAKGITNWGFQHIFEYLNEGRKIFLIFFFVLWIDSLFLL